MTDEQKHWDGTERRNRVAAPDVILDVLDRVKGMLDDHTTHEMRRYEDIAEQVARNREASERRHLELIQQQAEAIAAVEANTQEVRAMLTRIEHGFPADDPEGHRRYHEEVIRDLEAKRKLKEKLLEELTSKGLMAMLGVLLFSVWLYIKQEIHK